MIEFRWDMKPAADFDGLVRAISDDTLNSPRRSVVPLVDFFRLPSFALIELGRALRLELADANELAFEYAVPPQLGQGKPSYTDLMISCAEVSVAIEAKYTEPRYESVRSWLGAYPTPNRLAVLAGWISLINSRAQVSVGIESVLDLPYQLVHRTASACWPAAAERALVYLIFGDDPGEHYVEDVAALDRLLGEPPGLTMHILNIPMHATPAYSTLIGRWDSGERQLNGAVREAILTGPLFRFGSPRALYDRPRSRGSGC